MASNKGTRVLKVFKALEAHPIIGVSNKEIADGLGISPAYVSRDLAQKRACRVENARKVSNLAALFALQARFCAQNLTHG